MVELLLSVEWNDTAIISSIVGVVGTILGTVIGFLLSVLSRSGRQNVICKGIELSYYYGVNDIGDRVYRKESNFDGKVPERTKLSLELLITNSSEMPFNMNLVKLIIKKGEETFHGNLLDKNINKGSNSIIIHENIKTKQIGGKNSIYLELYTQFNEVYVYKETDTFYIEYIDVKGRTIHKKIKMGGIHETEI